MPGFSFLVTLLMGLGALGLRRAASPAVAGILAGGAALTALGLGVEVGWLVDVGVVGAAVSLGVIVGRTVAPRASAMGLILGVLSVADIIWVASDQGSSAGWMGQVGNFAIDFGSGTSSIGTLDLILAAAVAAHWIRRDAGVPTVLASAPLGMVLANIYVALSGADNLPLVPFITLGWLLVEGAHRLTRGRKDPG